MKKQDDKMYKNVNELIERQNNNPLLDGKDAWLFMKKREDYEIQIAPDRKNIEPNEPQEETTKLVMFFEYKAAVPPDESGDPDISIQSRWVKTITEEFIPLPESNEQVTTIDISTEDISLLIKSATENQKSTEDSNE